MERIYKTLWGDCIDLSALRFVSIDRFEPPICAINLYLDFLPNFLSIECDENNITKRLDEILKQWEKYTEEQKKGIYKQGDKKKMKSKKPETKNFQSNTAKSYISALSEFLLKLDGIDPCSITLNGARIGDIERYSCKIEMGGKHPEG